MVIVFHHLPDPYGFQDEANRTAKMGGRIIIVKP